MKEITVDQIQAFCEKMAESRDKAARSEVWGAKAIQDKARGEAFWIVYNYIQTAKDDFEEEQLCPLCKELKPCPTAEELE